LGLRLLVINLRGLVILTALLLVSCVTSQPNKMPGLLAKEAIEAAKTSGAPKLAPGLLFEAEQAYSRAVQHYVEREFDESTTEFHRARNLAEKAENTSRWARFKSGEPL
jgi:Domain of unknown function (DUF4398)